jgi:ABC-type transporter Mla subunit MlaD
MLDVHWTLTVSVPQLDALQQTMLELGAQIVAELTGIQDAINSLVSNQAAGQDALAAHLTAIETEIRQLGESPTQAELDHLADQVNAAAATAAHGAEELRAMTEQVAGMVPDAPPPA